MTNNGNSNYKNPDNKKRNYYGPYNQRQNESFYGRDQRYRDQNYRRYDSGKNPIYMNNIDIERGVKEVILKLDDAFSDMDFSVLGDIKKGLTKAVESTTNNVVIPFAQSLGTKNKTKRLPVNDPAIVRKNPFYLNAGLPMALFGFSTSVILLGSSFSIAPTGEALILANIFSLLSAGIGFMGLKRKRLKTRFLRYLREIGKSTVATTLDLSTAVSMDPKVVIKDLQKLIKNDIFKQGRLVENNMLFLLDIETYNAYKNNKAFYSDYYDSLSTPTEGHEINGDDKIIQNMIDSGYSKEEIDKELENQARTNEDEILQRALEDGKNYLNRMAELKHIIKNRIVVDKIESLEMIIGKIFNKVAIEKDKVFAIQKFMNYYLPTTIKLLEVYAQFESGSTATTDVASAMKEIEQTLDTIIAAFTNILANLFVETAMDIKSDISVLKSMLNQEGLLGSDFDLSASHISTIGKQDNLSENAKYDNLETQTKLSLEDDEEKIFNDIEENLLDNDSSQNDKIELKL